MPDALSAAWCPRFGDQEDLLLAIPFLRCATAATLASRELVDWRWEKVYRVLSTANGISLINVPLTLLGYLTAIERALEEDAIRQNACQPRGERRSALPQDQMNS
jgi:hypothetical protein